MSDRKNSYKRYEAVARDGWLEIRDPNDAGRWMACDAPREVRQ